MTLFAALTAKDGGDASSSPSSSSSPPEAIQLHSDTVIDFLNGTTIHLLNPAGNNNSSPPPNANSNEPSGGGEADAKTGGSSSADNVGGGGGAEGGRSRHFSALSYQAVQTQRDDALPNKPSATGAAAADAARRRHLRPDLGVWDCRVRNDDGGASAMILKRVVMGEKSTSKDINNPPEEEGEGEAAAADESNNNNDDAAIQPPIVMAVDVSDPSEVQPVVERMRNVILSVYGSKDKAATIPPRSCTTSIKALENSTFGRTKIQEEVGSSSSGERIALILAVIVPPAVAASSSASAADEYAERQARALVLYHLHKFGLEVDCTLCFVRKVEEGVVEAAAADENDPLLGRNSTMSVEELGAAIRRVALGLPPVDEGDVAAGEKVEEKKDEAKESDDASKPPSIHVPGSYDAELIHGAYLRNASCEGRWDASKDDLNVALPPRSAKAAASKQDETKGDEKDASAGDEAWLSQLASSVGLSPDAGGAAGEALTPTAADRAAERKKKASGAAGASKKRLTRTDARSRNKDAKPKDEKEVMNFFDNLLKK